MNKRDKYVSIKTRSDSETAEPRRWRNYVMMFVCALLLVTGFFFAGRQHFSSMDYGMKNSKLRHQVDELVAEKRRLLLAREVSLSPAEIRKAAKKTGITEPVADSQMTALVTAVTKDQAVPVATESNPLVIKTAAVTAAKTSAETAELKTDKPPHPLKKTSATE